MLRRSFFALSSLILSTGSFTQLLAAESPVDSTTPLKTVSSEFGLADGPAWDGAGGLFIPDVKGQTLFRYGAFNKKIQTVKKNVGRFSASFYNHGKLYVSDNGNGQIGIWKDGKVEPVHKFDQSIKPPVKPNDLVVDNEGGIYVTLTRKNQVAYITASGEAMVAVEGIITPNGLILSPDQKTLYVAAYVPKEIWAYDITANGKTANGKLLAKMDSGPDKGADGMTVDRAGNIYCAGPKHIWIWSPSGKLLDKIECPTRPINCAFGDRDMKSLFITGFGGLYLQRMKITGVPPQPGPMPATSKNNRRPSTDLPDGVTAHLDTVYAQYGDRKLLADIFVPNRTKNLNPAIVVVHGGGWLNGDKAKFRALALQLAARGYVTAAIEYRLGGDAKFPAGIQDCNAAVRFLRANTARYRIQPEKIGAVGGSAGGHLVGLMATGHSVHGLQGEGGNPLRSSKLQAAIVMAGPMEMTTGSVAERSRKDPTKSNSNKWLGKTIDEAPELYKLADAHVHIDKTSSPILFMVGEHDKPERNEPSRKKLHEHGVWTDVKVYKDGKHGCWNQLPWFNDMVADMDTFFQEQFKE